MVRRRLLAGLVDAALVLAWALLVAVAFAVASGLGWTKTLSAIWVQAGIGGCSSIGALAFFAAWESGPRQGTPGKRCFGLRVLDADGGRVKLPRAVLRNAAKITVPMLLAQLAGISLLAPGIDSWILTFIAVGLPMCYLVSLFTGSGRTLYDLVANTRVAEHAGRAYLGKDVSDVIESVPRRAI
ncbi:MAG: RDD family protein [Propionibacteriaceae bacterium]|jgi:uncharacterized RDD family membrane protein YckC|nr:RDD family protein [Propionibacteriaceae bacterium]